MKCTFNIVKNMVNGLPRDIGRVHLLTNKVDGIGDVWSGECEILEATNKASVKSGIFEGRTLLGGERTAAGGWGGNKLCILHGSAI